LNELGRKQADLFFRKYQNENFEIIHTSSLLRSQESVKSFIEKGIPWEAHEELDEISWGIFEGQPATHRFKMEYRKLLEDWENGKLDARAESGESPNEVSERQKRFIRYMLSKPEKKNLICMHGRAMRIFLPTLLNQDLRMMEEYPHHNLTLYKLIFDGNHFTIELFNNMDHLHSNEKD
jgi:probable phosphoglycerate mutase